MQRGGIGIIPSDGKFSGEVSPSGLFHWCHDLLAWLKLICFQMCLKSITTLYSQRYICTYWPKNPNTDKNGENKKKPLTLKCIEMTAISHQISNNCQCKHCWSHVRKMSHAVGPGNKQHFDAGISHTAVANDLWDLTDQLCVRVDTQAGPMHVRFEKDWETWLTMGGPQREAVCP